MVTQYDLGARALPRGRVSSVQHGQADHTWELHLAQLRLSWMPEGETLIPWQAGHNSRTTQTELRTEVL